MCRIKSGSVCQRLQILNENGKDGAKTKPGRPKPRTINGMEGVSQRCDPAQLSQNTSVNKTLCGGLISNTKEIFGAVCIYRY